MITLIVAVAVILQNTLVLALALLGFIPKTVSVELLFAIVNGAGTAQGYALSYFFGSSAGSAAKNDALHKLASGSDEPEHRSPHNRRDRAGRRLRKSPS